VSNVAARPIDLAGLQSGAAAYLGEERTRISVRGEDRVRWLNGVLSNDVSKLNGAQYACALTEKGKILADAIVIAGKEELSVWVPKRAAAPLVSHWDRFVIMDDVELAVDETHHLVFVQGAAAASPIERAGLAARALAFDDLGVGTGFLLEVKRGEAEEILKRIEREGAVRIESGDVHTFRVESARASFDFDFDEKTYVQEAGLEKRAVSFTKGCYHGQEVVCMLENRGSVNKRLVQLALDAGPPVQAGVEISLEGKSIGKLTSVVPHGDGTATALAMIKVAHANEGEKLTIDGRSAEVRKPAS
jgi:folate-binding protein YgfZ